LIIAARSIHSGSDFRQALSNRGAKLQRGEAFSIFHFPFFIGHWSSVIAWRATQSMSNDKSKMENGKWKMLLLPEFALS